MSPLVNYPRNKSVLGYTTCNLLLGQIFHFSLFISRLAFF